MTETDDSQTNLSYVLTIAYSDATAKLYQARERTDGFAAEGVRAAEQYLQRVERVIRERDTLFADLQAQLAEARRQVESELAHCADMRHQRDQALAQAKRLREALQQYADRQNWGYYDGSGCPKGYGAYTDACFLGPQVADAALAAKD